MGLFGLFKKKSDETKVGNVEDFISLTRVYFQSVIATNLGITNIRFLPDVANFKRLFKVPDVYKRQMALLFRVVSLMIPVFSLLLFPKGPIILKQTIWGI